MEFHPSMQCYFSHPIDIATQAQVLKIRTWCARLHVINKITESQKDYLSVEREKERDTVTLVGQSFTMGKAPRKWLLSFRLWLIIGGVSLSYVLCRKERKFGWDSSISLNHWVLMALLYYTIHITFLYDRYMYFFNFYNFSLEFSVIDTWYFLITLTKKKNHRTIFKQVFCSFKLAQSKKSCTQWHNSPLGRIPLFSRQVVASPCVEIFRERKGPRAHL